MWLLIYSLYTIGFNPQLAKLYPEVQFPVSRGTPMIAPTVRWDHTKEWPIPKEGYSYQKQSFEQSVIIDVSNPDYENLKGHVIDGLYNYLFITITNMSQAKQSIFLDSTTRVGKHYIFFNVFIGPVEHSVNSEYLTESVNLTSD